MFKFDNQIKTNDRNQDTQITAGALIPLNELLQPKPQKPIAAVLKRGEAQPVPFDRDLIASAILKSSIASGKNYTTHAADEISREVEDELRKNKVFENSGRSIPHADG